ncbi:MAG: GH92 family glycosyl hydrolase [Acidobacteria bacterium]|nr:GH92 family glycosyl hydrolase [Acidobacteriota bacterium]
MRNYRCPQVMSFLELCRTGRLLTLAVLTLLTAHGLLLTATAQTRDYTRWVNPFIGTGGHGHTFPGATLPFGMVQLSPDTRIDNWDGSSGYHYSDDIIYGFSQTHLSGTGIPDGCDILFMPTVGNRIRTTNPEDVASPFSHSNEKAEPGYYSVLLDNGGILAEMTATKRVGFHRYTFPKTADANIVLNLTWRDRVLGIHTEFVGDRRIEGYRKSSSWAKNQTVYFVAEFSKPFRNFDSGREEDWDGYIASFQFDARTDPTVQLKVAISYVSIEGARKNLEAELPHWDFDKVRADAKAAWNKELSKIEVSGGTDEQTTNFYTALYHTMIHPNVFNDVDGKYLGHDRKIHQLPGYLNRSDAESQRGDKKKNSASPRLGGENSSHYTVFSLWDTFRATHPLYTIIDQRRTVDYINSFIRIYEQGGRLPVWELWGEETDTMIGYHSVSVIADAMAKGIEGFDYEKAYEAANHSANLDHHGLAAYKKRGYISAEDDNESVSKTLEYAYNDWCIAQMARLMERRYPAKKAIFQKDVEAFTSRAHYFMNLFDPQTGFMRPKRNGGFIEPFAPNEVTFHFTEGNSWQYSFFVPHNVDRLMALMGGRDKFAAKLDELFTTDQKLAGRFQPDITGLIGQYAHGNEPSHHIPYLYNYAGQPWKTQKYVRKIMDEFYKNAPDGLIGNEDCGQMSAWYVLSAAGFYPVAPGAPQYDIGSPIFEEVKFNLENGKSFRVIARNQSVNNRYVRSASLNGTRWNSTTIDHRVLIDGGVLEFTMSPEPVHEAFSFSRKFTPFNFVPVPSISGPRTFRETATISIGTLEPGTKIFYTTDGSEPGERSTQYSAPFEVAATTMVRAIAIGENSRRSFPVEAVFTKRESDWTVLSTSGYSTQYTGGGDDAMVDGLRGTRNFASGEWQGYQGKVLEAVIDLKERRRVVEVGGSFLQTTRSWIWMPSRIEFEASGDGENFTKMAEVKTDVALTDETPQVKEFLSRLAAPVTARYIRVRAFNIGPIPAWHPGAGGDPWVFVDEVIIR